jgi:hypothetical protein
MTHDSNEDTSTPPIEIRRAVQFATAGILFGVLAQFFTWDYNPAHSSNSFRVTVLVFTAAVMLGLFSMLLKGARWARAVYVVFYIAGLLLYINPLLRAALFAEPRLLKFVTLVNTLISLYLLWAISLSPGRLWFKKRMASRAA